MKYKFRQEILMKGLVPKILFKFVFSNAMIFFYYIAKIQINNEKPGKKMSAKSKVFSFILIISVLFIFLLSANLAAQSSAGIQTPQKYFGFKPGTDRMLIDYEQLISYLKKVDIASTRIKLVEIGESPLGKKMYICFISSAQNISNLDRLKNINKELALNSNLTESARQKLFAEGKVFILATLSMHSDEVGPSQAAPIIVYDLATTTDPLKISWLNNTVYMMVPCHNPDGMDMVVNHYKKYKGTKYEGSSMPGVYHKYVGHDNNRDFVTLSQKDTKAIARIYNTTWYPQVMVEKHQMGSTTARYYAPPPHDPIAENIDAGIWNWSWVFGSNLITDMTKDGLTGVSQHYLFDDYWPGSTETCIWKNVIGFLTECASADYAKPVYVEPTELNARGKGLSEYKKSINMPEPWKGGWWRLSNIIDYEISSTISIIKTAALYKDRILQYRNDLCKREVKLGKTQPPYYYILPLKQHDESELVETVNLLNEHGIEIYKITSNLKINGKNFNSGDIVIPLAQPYRAFIKEVMEKQNFPVRHYTPNGKIIKPYDITTWSLPLHRGLTSIEVNTKPAGLENSLQKLTFPYSLKSSMPENYRAAFFTVNNNESFKAAFTAKEMGLKVERLTENVKVKSETIPKGSFVVYANNKLGKLIKTLTVSPVFSSEKIKFSSEPLNIPRIALIETYFHDMDAGWTRFIFDTYNLPYKVIHPGEVEKTNFEKNFDVIVFPNSNKDILMSGKYKSKNDYYPSSYPPEYTKGIGKMGMQKILSFLDNGGKIISWGNSTGLFMGTLTLEHGKNVKEEFRLPVNDVSSSLQKNGLYVPGSLVRLKLKKDHPITYGMGSEVGVFFRAKPVFTTSIPHFDMDRRVIGYFPEKNLLLSGYGEKLEKLGNKVGLVWVKKNKGQLVLFAFNPQFRASTQSNYKLLFNSLLLK